jgi:hypothetical protein
MRRRRGYKADSVATNRKPRLLGFTKVETPQVSTETFLEVFMRNLILAKNKHPEIYQWPDSNVLEVFRSYVDGFQDGTFTRQAHAVAWTCKELGIENDRETITKIFNSGGDATENED